MKGLWGIAIGTVCLAGASASAEILTIHGLGFGENVKVKLGATGIAAFGGEQMIDIDGSSVFASYCVDLTHVNAVGNSYTVTPKSTNLLNTPNGGKVAWLYNSKGVLVNSNQKGAALQLAIWDALYDGGDGFASGSLVDNGSNATTVALAETYLVDLGANTDEATWFDADHNGNQYQDMIGPQASPPVPEPFTMALGAATLGMALKRRLRKNA